MENVQRVPVAERLREAMLEAGKKQADLARETGIDKGALSSYLSGKYEPKQKAIAALAHALNVTEKWLWGYDVPAERPATTPMRMREAMDAIGKKQIDLAKETGLSHSTISRYLSGAVEPRQDAMHKLARALNVSEMWLWGYDVPKIRTTEQKKNDTMVDVVSTPRNDPEFFDVVSQLAELPAGEYAIIKAIISALGNK